MGVAICPTQIGGDIKLTELYRMDLPYRAISVNTYLANRAGKEDRLSQPWQRDLKLSESTGRRPLDDLRKAGLIQTEQRYRENDGSSCLLNKLNKFPADCACALCICFVRIIAIGQYV